MTPGGLGIYNRRTPESDLQTLLDALASRIQAAVILEDLDFHLLAHTSQGERIDEVRRSSILGRRATPEVKKWFEQWGILGAREPIRTPANVRLGALERWCIPVRYRDRHLGYVWLLESGTVDRAGLESAAEIAEQVGAVLYRRGLSAQADNDLLRLLLTPNPQGDERSRDMDETLDSYGPFVAAVVSAPTRTGEPNASVGSDHALAIARATEESPGRLLGGMISDLGALLVPLRNADDLSDAKRLAATLRRIAFHLNERLNLLVAIGSACDLNAASRSYAEARRALRIAQTMPDYGPVVTWNDLGVFRPLSLLPLAGSDGNLLDPRVASLIAETELALTAETYLELAGSAQATAARLFIHRATLYQRLHRIAELYGLDLRSNGDHRLIAHLGFKLARLGRG